MGVEYWYAQQASATGYAQKELSMYAATQVGEDSYLRAFVMKGFVVSHLWVFQFT
jgi:hypothetical protein